MKNTIEKQTAETILQTPYTIGIGEKTYQAARPSLATLIEVSKFISQLPINIEKVDAKNEDTVLREVLAIAWECGFVGDILAILILGSKGIKPVHVPVKLFGFIPTWKTKTTYPQKELATEILEEMDPKEHFEKTITLLQELNVAFFLSTLIFLKGVNLLRKTTTTVSGH